MLYSIIYERVPSFVVGRIIATLVKINSGLVLVFALCPQLIGSCEWKLSDGAESNYLQLLDMFIAHGVDLSTVIEKTNGGTL